MRPYAFLLILALPVLSARPVEIEKLATIDVPGFQVEIGAWCPGERLLLATNPHWKTLDVFEVPSWDPPVLRPLDFDDDRPGEQGFYTMREATSVTVLPERSVAVISVLGASVTAPGMVIGYDLRAEQRGRMLWMQPVGFHPDSLSASPDGKWVAVACEAEGHPDTPGSVWFLDARDIRADQQAHATPPRATVVFDQFSALLECPNGEVEPEYVAWDPRSRFAAVTCQENDAVLLFDTRAAPALAGVFRTDSEAQPDGVSVLDGVPGPDGRPGCLIGVAEEGALDGLGRLKGQSASFWWVDPERLDEPARMLSRVDLRPLVGGKKPAVRLEPEGILLARHQDTVLGFVVTEKGDHLLAFDLADPAKPRLLQTFKTGDRPEGLLAVREGGRLYVVSCDEGDPAPGEITVLRVR